MKRLQGVTDAYEAAAKPIPVLEAYGEFKGFLCPEHRETSAAGRQQAQRKRQDLLGCVRERCRGDDAVIRGVASAWDVVFGDADTRANEATHDIGLNVEPAQCLGDLRETLKPHILDRVRAKLARRGTGDRDGTTAEAADPEKTADNVLKLLMPLLRAKVRLGRPGGAAAPSCSSDGSQRIAADATVPGPLKPPTARDAVREAVGELSVADASVSCDHDSPLEGRTYKRLRTELGNPDQTWLRELTPKAVALLLAQTADWPQLLAGHADGQRPDARAVQKAYLLAAKNLATRGETDHRDACLKHYKDGFFDSEAGKLVTAALQGITERTLTLLQDPDVLHALEEVESQALGICSGRPQQPLATPSSSPSGVSFDVQPSMASSAWLDRLHALRAQPVSRRDVRTEGPTEATKLVLELKRYLSGMPPPSVGQLSLDDLKWLFADPLLLDEEREALCDLNRDVWGAGPPPRADRMTPAMLTYAGHNGAREQQLLGTQSSTRDTQDGANGSARTDVCGLTERDWRVAAGGGAFSFRSGHGPIDLSEALAAGHVVAATVLARGQQAPLLDAIEALARTRGDATASNRPLALQTAAAALIALRTHGTAAQAAPASPGDDSMAKALALLSQCQGSEPALRLMLDAEAKRADVGSASGETPASLAYLLGLALRNPSVDLDVVRLLLSRGAAPDSRTEGRDTPLMMAASRGHVEALELLMRQPMDEAAKRSLLHTTLDRTLDIAFYPRSDAPASLRDVIVALTRTGQSVNRVHARTGSTPLMVAAQEGDRELVQRLLDCGADPRAIRKKDGRSAFDCALAGRQDGRSPMPVIMDLIKGGLPVDSFSRVTHETPLMVAARTGDVEAMATLLDTHGADPRAAHPSTGQSALDAALTAPSAKPFLKHWATHKAAARLLFSHHVHPDTRTRADGSTCLMYASQVGDAAFVRELIDTFHADPKVINSSNGTTAMDFAVLPSRNATGAPCFEVVSALIDAGVPVDHRDVDFDRTPLMHATAAADLKAVQELLNRGADPRAVDAVSGRSVRDFATGKPSLRNTYASVAAVLTAAVTVARWKQSEGAA